MGAGRILVGEKRPASWDSKGPRLVPIGGIGINRVETNNPIMTVKKLIILDTTVTLIKEIGDTNESKLQYT